MRLKFDTTKKFQSQLFFFFSTASTLYGPLHTKQAVDQYLAAIEQAKQQGGTVVCGGKVQSDLRSV